MEFWIARNQEQLDFFYEHMKRVWQFPSPLRIEWREGSARSNDQNALIHAMFRDIALQLKKKTGEDYTQEWVKSYLKRRFGRVERLPDPESGEQMPYLVSTAKYTKGEMAEFVERIHAWAAECGITV